MSQAALEILPRRHSRMRWLRRKCRQRRDIAPGWRAIKQIPCASQVTAPIGIGNHSASPAASPSVIWKYRKTLCSPQNINHHRQRVVCAPPVIGQASDTALSILHPALRAQPPDANWLCKCVRGNLAKPVGRQPGRQSWPPRQWPTNVRHISSARTDSRQSAFTGIPTGPRRSPPAHQTPAAMGSGSSDNTWLARIHQAPPEAPAGAARQTAPGVTSHAAAPTSTPQRCRWSTVRRPDAIRNAPAPGIKRVPVVQRRPCRRATIGYAGVESPVADFHA